MSNSAFFHQEDEETMMVGGMDINDWYAFNDSSVMGFDTSPDPHAHIKNYDDNRRASICSLGASSRDHQYHTNSGSIAIIGDDDDDDDDEDDNTTIPSPFSDLEDTPTLQQDKFKEEEPDDTTKRISDSTASTMTSTTSMSSPSSRRSRAPPRRTLSSGKVWKSLRSLGVSNSNNDKDDKFAEGDNASGPCSSKRADGHHHGKKKLKKSSSFKWIKKIAASA